MSKEVICPDCFGYMLDYEYQKGYKKCITCGFTRKIGGNGMVTKEELLKNRDKLYKEDYTKEISDNLDKLLVVLNKIRARYGKPMIVVSGWRPPSINEKTANAAAKSNHLLGLAADIRDIDGKFMKWCLDNLDFLSELGVYLEDFRWTKTWCHIQIVPPKSGKRIYRPSMEPPSDPLKWDGDYNPKFDKV